MNSEFYNLIGKSIDCLSNAKQNINDRKRFINEASEYIKQSINKINNKEER